MNLGFFTGKLMADAEIRTFDQSGEAPRVAVAFKVKVKNKNNPRQPLVVKCLSFQRDHRLDIVVEKLVADQSVTVSGDVSIEQWEEEDGYVYSCFALEINSMDIHYKPRSREQAGVGDIVLEELVSNITDDRDAIVSEQHNARDTDSKTPSSEYEEHVMDIHEAQQLAMMFQDDDGVNTSGGSGF